MTINQLIRELLSMPKAVRMKELPWGPEIRIKTKKNHEVLLTVLEHFYEVGFQEIPIEFDVISPRQISEKIH